MRSWLLQPAGLAAQLLTETAGPRAHTHMDRRELHMETTRGAQRAPFVRPGPLSVPG